jgi:hypothetical protein
VDQLRTALVSSGYQVDAAHTWDWTQPSFTSFRVSDSATGRVLTVVVYPTTSAADTARLQAAHGQAQNATVSDGPYLAVGFGPSTWNGNVAMVESTESELERLYQAQVDRDNGVVDEVSSVAADFERPAVAVDVDFQEALVRSAVNL